MADIIDDIEKREGPDSNNPADHGGPTSHGISKAANPDLWIDGPPTEAQSRARYEARYLHSPGFDKVEDSRLRAQLVDYGVNSGPAVAIMKLQAILKVEADGVLGPKTLVALGREDQRWLNNQLVGARVRMLGKIVTRDKSQLTFINGWLDRACSFIL